MGNVIKWVFIVFVFLAFCVLYVNIKMVDGPIDWAHQIGVAVETTVNFVVNTFKLIF